MMHRFLKNGKFFQLKVHKHFHKKNFTQKRKMSQSSSTPSISQRQTLKIDFFPRFFLSHYFLWVFLEGEENGNGMSEKNVTGRRKKKSIALALNPN